jgi:hypothetical protein
MDPMTQGQLKEWFLMFVTFGLMGWVAYLGASMVRRKQKNDMQKALLEKFSSAHDFAEFMQSPAGQKYVMGFADAITSPRGTILSSIRIGFVLSFAGDWCLDAMASWIAWRIGCVAFLGGIGFLCSAGVAYFLARKTDWKSQE